VTGYWPKPKSCWSAIRCRPTWPIGPLHCGGRTRPRPGYRTCWLRSVGGVGPAHLEPGQRGGDRDRGVRDGRGLLLRPRAGHRHSPEGGRHIWPPRIQMTTLAGATLGVIGLNGIGLGGIGQQVGRPAKSVGMRVIGSRWSASEIQSDVDGADVVLPARPVGPNMCRCGVRDRRRLRCCGPGWGSCRESRRRSTVQPSSAATERTATRGRYSRAPDTRRPEEGPRVDLPLRSRRVRPNSAGRGIPPDPGTTPLAAWRTQASTLTRAGAVPPDLG
jgi:hypothetical protein